MDTLTPAGTRIASQNRSEHIALAMLFAGAVAIAFSPIFVRLSELGPTATAFWRVAFAAPALGAWLTVENRRRGPAARRPRSTRDWGWLALAGFCYAGDLAVWHWSLKLTSVANSTLLANFAPIFVTPAAYFLFGERFRPAFLVGLVLAIAGAALLMGQSLTLSPAHLLGDGLGLVTAAFYGGHMPVVRRARRAFPPPTLTAWSPRFPTGPAFPAARPPG